MWPYLSRKWAQRLLGRTAGRRDCPGCPPTRPLPQPRPLPCSTDKAKTRERSAKNQPFFPFYLSFSVLWLDTIGWTVNCWKQNGDTDRDLVIFDKTNIHYSTVSTVLQFLAQWHISIGGSPVCTVIPETGWKAWYDRMRTNPAIHVGIVLQCFVIFRTHCWSCQVYWDL